MKLGTTRTFCETYDELRLLGYPDWQIAKRMGITLLSLERQLVRYGRPISEQLREMAGEERAKRRPA
ncbi:helix-turn-helix DNA binding protein [Mycobacterium phage Mask]|nr:hypothetical protein SEA_RITA_69 [Mycobacterium phage Rita]UVT31502.1 helix-turn-helix DNA binding protein [Mycobacterium phage Sejanus]UVT31604.1 helix-turn-helix DNA binding protein [Mycobacterium phage Mask]